MVPLHFTQPVEAIRCHLLADLEARDPDQTDQVLAVIRLLDRSDSPGAADLLQSRVVAIVIVDGLDHADQTVAIDGVFDHLQVARLEDAQRQAATGKQKNSGERKHRNDLR